MPGLFFLGRFLWAFFVLLVEPFFQHGDIAGAGVGQFETFEHEAGVGFVAGLEVPVHGAGGGAVIGGVGAEVFPKQFRGFGGRAQQGVAGGDVIEHGHVQPFLGRQGGEHLQGFGGAVVAAQQAGFVARALEDLGAFGRGQMGQGFVDLFQRLGDLVLTVKNVSQQDVAAVFVGIQGQGVEYRSLGLGEIILVDEFLRQEQAWADEFGFQANDGAVMGDGFLVLGEIGRQAAGHFLQLRLQRIEFQALEHFGVGLGGASAQDVGLGEHGMGRGIIGPALGEAFHIAHDGFDVAVGPGLVQAGAQFLGFLAGAFTIELALAPAPAPGGDQGRVGGIVGPEPPRAGQRQRGPE